MGVIEAMVLSAISLQGTIYRWGGKHPAGGLDCSGLVSWILKGAALDPPGDQTAQGLYDALEGSSRNNVYGAGSIAFFGESVRKITHVAFCINDKQMIESHGGDHLTLTAADAIAKRAGVQLTTIDHRKDLVAMLRPNYTRIGVMP